MTDPAILFVKPKTLRATDKKALRSAGVIVVEVDDPASVKLVRATAELSSGAMLGAALRAIAETTSITADVRTRFAAAIYDAYLAERPV